MNKDNMKDRIVWSESGVSSQQSWRLCLEKSTWARPVYLASTSDCTNTKTCKIRQRKQTDCTSLVVGGCFAAARGMWRESMARVEGMGDFKNVCGLV